MFILVLKYVKPIEEIEKLLNAHVNYLNKYYSLKKFICSGRRNPRTGGIILCTSKSLTEVNNIIKEDPFYIEDAAEYEIIEFIPSKYDNNFKCFIEK